MTRSDLGRILPDVKHESPQYLFSALLLIASSVSGTAASDPILNVNTAGYQAVAAPDSLVTATGISLANTTESAGTAPVEVLGGTSVLVRDGGGVERRARILFVSPRQVNYLLPAETATGTATVKIQSADGTVSEGPLKVQTVAPGLFTANANGKGVAAAWASLPSGSSTIAPAFHVDSQYQRYLTAPIDVIAANGTVSVTIYATGIRSAKDITARLGAQTIAVAAVRPSPDSPGLDEVVVQIPQSMASRGVAALQLTADGIPSNPALLELLHYQYLNLGFEDLTQNGGLLYWYVAGAGYDLSQAGAGEPVVAHSGNRSLRIRNVSAQRPGFANSLQEFPRAGGLEAARGKHVRLSAFIKTQNITRDWAGLWFRVDGPSGTISLDNAQCASGTTDWQPCVIDRDISPDASLAVFGVLHTGDGTAWFDDLQIEIDGHVYPQKPPLGDGPTPEQAGWVQNTAKAFATPMAGNGFDDLGFVTDLVGDARIVGLGEGTHGTSEFFRMKHRLLEYLATNLGFTVFAIEANMPEAYRLNDYVLYGIGNPKDLLKGMYFWTWNTQEVLDMIEWMRKFNASGKGPLQFTGFDMQTPTVAIANVQAFLAAADPAYLSTARAAYAQAAAVYSIYRTGITQSSSGVSPVVAATHEIWRYMEERRPDYLTRFTAAQVEWAIQNGRIVEQATQLIIANSSYRDQSMAANIEWILDHNPAGTKMVVWAHNGHISRYGSAMGSYLARAHDMDYLPIAQLFHEGRYNAVNSSTLIANTAVPSYPGSLEYVLHSTGMPRLVLDLRKVAAGDSASSWLLNDLQLRSIGAVANAGWGFTGTLLADYDAVIFFDRTTPSALLPF